MKLRNLYVESEASKFRDAARIYDGNDPSLTMRLRKEFLRHKSTPAEIVPKALARVADHVLGHGIDALLGGASYQPIGDDENEKDVHDAEEDVNKFIIERYGKEAAARFNQMLTDSGQIDLDILRMAISSAKNIVERQAEIDDLNTLLEKCESSNNANMMAKAKEIREFISNNINMKRENYKLPDEMLKDLATIDAIDAYSED